MRDYEFMIEAEPVGPKPPLSPAQATKRAKRQTRLNQQTSDENARHAAKIRDLKTRVP